MHVKPNYTCLRVAIACTPQECILESEVQPNIEAEAQPDVEPRCIVEPKVQLAANPEPTLKRGVQPNAELEVGPNPDPSDCPQASLKCDRPLRPSVATKCCTGAQWLHVTEHFGSLCLLSLTPLHVSMFVCTSNHGNPNDRNVWVYDQHYTTLSMCLPLFAHLAACQY